MARLALNKASLAREQRQLDSFQRFLPSLDLKRQQLLAERAKARRQLGETRDAVERRMVAIGERIPMLANWDVDVSGLVHVGKVRLRQENVVGTRLPELMDAEIHVNMYGLMGKPHWVDGVVAELRSVLELRVRAKVEERRLAQLNGAVRVITQRVNLFDKVLIPRTRRNIKRIRVHLADAERASVVTSKIAKSKRTREDLRP